MKISRVFVVILMMALFVAGWAASGHTAEVVYVCQVNGAGPSAGVVQINLTDTANPPAFTNQLFRVPPAQANQFLAVALQAISLWKNVNVTLYPRGGMLSSIYLPQ